MALRGIVCRASFPYLERCSTGTFLVVLAACFLYSIVFVVALFPSFVSLRYFVLRIF